DGYLTGRRSKARALGVWANGLYFGRWAIPRSVNLARVQTSRTATTTTFLGAAGEKSSSEPVTGISRTVSNSSCADSRSFWSVGSWPRLAIKLKAMAPPGRSARFTHWQKCRDTRFDDTSLAS